MLDPECEGCTSAVLGGKYWDCLAIPNYNKKISKLCPCRNCLIKMMCDEKCPEFILFLANHGQWKLNYGK